MVSATYGSYFATMAAVGGTLVGLIFIAISINPEAMAASKGLVARRAKVASSFTALLNPFIISLFALIPNESLGYVTLIVGILDFVSSLAMIRSLLQHRVGWLDTIQRVVFLLGSFVIYGLEIYYATSLLQTPKNNMSLSSLASLLIIIYILGISRAWEVIGAPQFRFHDWIADRLLKNEKKSTPKTSETASDVAPLSKEHEDTSENKS